MTAVVYSTDNKGVQREVCRLSSDENGRVVPSVRHSSGLAVLNSPLINPESGRKLTRDDGDEFLKLLPAAYSGTRMRVGLEMDGVKGDLPGHPFRGNQWDGGGVTEQVMSPKTKSEIAKASATRVGAEIQRYSEERNEPALAMVQSLNSGPEGSSSALLTDGLTEKDDPDDSGWTSEED